MQQIKDPKKLTEIAKEAVIKYTDQIEINRQLKADNAALRAKLARLVDELSKAHDMLYEGICATNEEMESIRQAIAAAKEAE